MATYEEILDAFFPLRFPRGFASAVAFEAQPGLEDRTATEALLAKMAVEAPATAKDEFQVDYFPVTLECHGILDEFLTPELAERWIEQSDPEDENNHFKLTVCELAVHLGNALIDEFGGTWRCARFPNYFDSVVVLAHVEVHVFDMIIKKCSDDHRDERISETVLAIAGANRPESG